MFPGADSINLMTKSYMSALNFKIEQETMQKLETTINTFLRKRSFPISPLNFLILEGNVHIF